jgi:hypothetical protein
MKMTSTKFRNEDDVQKKNQKWRRPKKMKTTSEKLNEDDPKKKWRRPQTKLKKWRWPKVIKKMS